MGWVGLNEKEENNNIQIFLFKKIETTNFVLGIIDFWISMVREYYLL